MLPSTSPWTPLRAGRRRSRRRLRADPAQRRHREGTRRALALARVSARAPTSLALRCLRRARKRALRALPRAPAASVRPALRALRSAYGLAGGSLSGMRRPPDRLRQRALGTSLLGRRSKGGRGLERARPAPPGRRSGRDCRRGCPASAGGRAHLRAGAARAGALSRLSPGPVTGSRVGAYLGAAVRSAARACGLAAAPARSGSQRAQPECRRRLCASARCQPARSRLPDRRCLHQRRHHLGLCQRSAPSRMPPGRGSCPCQGCSRMLERGRVRARRATVRISGKCFERRPDTYPGRMQAASVAAAGCCSWIGRVAGPPHLGN